MSLISCGKGLNPPGGVRKNAGEAAAQRSSKKPGRIQTYRSLKTRVRLCRENKRVKKARVFLANSKGRGYGGA